MCFLDEDMEIELSSSFLESLSLAWEICANCFEDLVVSYTVSDVLFWDLFVTFVNFFFDAIAFTFELFDGDLEFLATLFEFGDWCLDDLTDT